MALIKCPECGKENVSNSAVACPECGFGIREYSERLEYESKRKNVIVCPYCGRITGFPDSPVGSQEYESMQCSSCKNQMVHIDFSVDEYMKTANYDPVAMSSSDVSIYSRASKEMNREEHKKMYKKILHEIIEPMGKLEKDTMHYKSSLLAAGEMELEEYNALILSSRQNYSSPIQQKTNIPKCPTCGSENIEKISSFDKASGTFLFGLFSKNAKSQFKCKNCGYKW